MESAGRKELPPPAGPPKLLMRALDLLLLPAHILPLDRVAPPPYPRAALAKLETRLYRLQSQSALERLGATEHLHCEWSSACASMVSWLRARRMPAAILVTAPRPEEEAAAAAQVQGQQQQQEQGHGGHGGGGGSAAGEKRSRSALEWVVRRLTEQPAHATLPARFLELCRALLADGGLRGEGMHLHGGWRGRGGSFSAGAALDAAWEGEGGGDVIFVGAALVEGGGGGGGGGAAAKGGAGTGWGAGETGRVAQHSDRSGSGNESGGSRSGSGGQNAMAVSSSSATALAAKVASQGGGRPATKLVRLISAMLKAGAADGIVALLGPLSTPGHPDAQGALAVEAMALLQALALQGGRPSAAFCCAKALPALVRLRAAHPAHRPTLVACLGAVGALAAGGGAAAEQLVAGGGAHAAVASLRHFPRCNGVATAGAHAVALIAWHLLLEARALAAWASAQRRSALAMMVRRLPRPQRSSALVTARALAADDVVAVLGAALAIRHGARGKEKQEQQQQQQEEEEEEEEVLRHDWRGSLHPLCALRALAMLPPCRREMARARDGTRGGTLELLRKLQRAAGASQAPHAARSRWKRAARAGSDFHDLRVFHVSDWGGGAREAAAFALERTVAEFEEDGAGASASSEGAAEEDDLESTELSDKTAFWIELD